MTTPSFISEVVEETLESIVNKLDDGYRNPTFGMVDFLREKLTAVYERGREDGQSISYEAGKKDGMEWVMQNLTTALVGYSTGCKEVDGKIIWEIDINLLRSRFNLPALTTEGK